jgi:electron transport complex protein RnfD
MIVPPTVSPLLIVIGTAVGILIGKEVFGGLGYNVFNPALVGRAFLSAAYPVQMTTYTAPNTVFSFLPASVDATTGATPLAAAKFEQTTETFSNLFFGQIGGSIGETSSLFIIVGGLVLVAVRIVRWEMVLSYLGSVFVFGGIFYLIDPSTYPDPVFHLFAGGLMLAAFYMATDMVSTPYTRLGTVIFGAGAGLLVIVIRLFGGFPEGVMYSILLMNAITPILNRTINNRVFGAPQREEAEQS